MGDETLLFPDLVNAVRWSAAPPASRGAPHPENSCWERGDDYLRIPDGGSCNIPKLREAIRYVRRPQKYGSVERWTFILTQERDSWGFMAFEPFSAIYGAWHLEAHLLVLRESIWRGDEALTRLSLEWLQLFYMTAAFAYTRGHRVASGGMRSAGHMAAAGLREYIVEQALTAPGGAVALPAPPDPIAPYLLKSDERQMLDLFRPQVEQAAAKVRAAYPEAGKLAACYVDGWSVQVPSHFLRAADGTAQWCERNCNANTAPVLAGIAFFAAATLARHAADHPNLLALAAPAAAQPRDHLVLWLPPGGGGRFRSWDEAHCTREGDRLSYTSSVWGAHRAPLPSDGAVEYLWQGKTFSLVGGGDRPDSKPSTPPDPPTPADPPRPPDPRPPDPPDPSQPPKPPVPKPPDRAELSAIAAGIAALQLARSQRALQDQIVAELASGQLRRSPAQIADQVASFGIGAGQPQAAGWQQLIARLRTLA